MRRKNVSVFFFFATCVKKTCCATIKQQLTLSFRAISRCNYTSNKISRNSAQLRYNFPEVENMTTICLSQTFCDSRGKWRLKKNCLNSISIKASLTGKQGTIDFRSRLSLSISQSHPVPTFLEKTRGNDIACREWKG